MTLGGKALEKPFINYSDLLKGPKIRFEMKRQPGKVRCPIAETAGSRSVINGPGGLSNGATPHMRHAINHIVMKKILIPVCALFLCMPAFASQEDRRLVLENKHIKAVFDTENGALVRITNKHSGWEIMRREVLGQSFELLLPMDGHQMSETDCRYNVIKGVEQARPVIEQDNGKIAFVWSGLQSGLMNKRADIIFKGEVRLTDRGLEFSGSFDAITANIQ